MQEFLNGFAAMSVYFAIAATTVLLLRFTIKIPHEVFRKTLHFVLLGSVFVFVFAFDNWYISALAAIIFEIIVYPILILFEKLKKYSEITTERKKGELKASLMLVFTMFAIVIAVCWGLMKDKYLVIASILAWGVGDAFAALIGKRFGKHKIKASHADGKKSYEGTIAMFLFSCISVATVIIYHGHYTLGGYIVIPVITGFVSAITELYSKNGMDTVICPLSAMITLNLLTLIFGR